ncbi:MAG: hypothetical protein JWN90_131 [Parcubacteria group bacterium]|nr:hypothetical protein [Parcubacteria group bacterium]
MSKELISKIFHIFVYIFAAIGFFLVVGYFAIKFGFTNQKGIIDQQREAFFGASNSAAVEQAANAPSYHGPWQNSEEWTIMNDAVTRDQVVIDRAAADSGVPARIIVANLVAEQLRLFFTDREDYKKFFYPLKILGPQSQFSWGVMGMKEATAVQVENNLKDPSSPYYLGPAYEHVLDFKTTDVAGERFTRMTDQHDHYWSYLYAGLYIKEVEAQWAKAGFPIDGNPAVISTLYNIGFTHSTPNANPQVGGAAITLSDGTRSFGALAAEFYNSNLLPSFAH